MYSITERVGLVDFYIEYANTLEKKDTTLRVCDLDDTLFCRTEQLEAEELLKNNRGWAGITIVTNTLWLRKYTETYYHWNFPKDIFSLLNKDSDIILTAGMPELQHMKAKQMWILDYTVRVVSEGRDKILETIRYILFELKYIPSEIIVYEDRPQFFVKYRELIEGLLGCKLTIMYVEMDGNDGYRKIEEI